MVDAVDAAAIRSRAGRAGWAGLVATVAVVAVALLVAVAPWATDDFGYSFDGFNASVWGGGARAMADDPIGSRLGGIHEDGYRYANHPPLTVWAAAVASAVSGDREPAVRAPAVGATILALAALALLLRDAGLRWGAAATGVVLAGTTGMALTYGAMLDTPVVGLPFGLLALAAAQRVWQRRPPHPAVLGGAGALAAVAGWQALLLAALATATCLLAPVDGDGASPRRGAAALGLGVAAGTALTVGWAAGVHGSLRPLLDQAGRRTGATGPGVRTGWFDAMDHHLTDLYGPRPVLLAIAAAVAVGLIARLGRSDDGDAAPWWRPVGLRPVVALLAVTIVGYTLLFRNGAAVHDYWTYWGLALVGVGAAAVVELLADDDRSPLRRVPVPARTAGLAAVVMALAAVGYGRQTNAETRIRNGLDVVPILAPVPRPDDPAAVAVGVYGASPDVPWAEYAVHGQAVPVDDEAGLRRLPPDLPVVVVLRAPPSAALRDLAIVANERFALVAAGDLAEHVGG